MATNSTSAMAAATPFVNIPRHRDAAADHTGTAAYEAAADALLALPTSLSPEMAAHSWQEGAMSPPLLAIDRDGSAAPDSGFEDGQPRRSSAAFGSMPLSVGALSSLDESITITPAMLARHHLPKIMLGQGPIPIRDVLYELTQTVPGFSRIPPAKARRIVVAALEKPSGGGLAGEVVFDKTGWGKWHAHVKGSSPRDSGIGSFQDTSAVGSLSPERHNMNTTTLSSSARPSADPAHRVRKPIASPRLAPHRFRQQRGHGQASGGSWSSLPEEDESSPDHGEIDMDMDVLEEAAERMSLDGHSNPGDSRYNKRNPSDIDDDSSDSISSNSDTDDDTWAAEGVDALRKASLPFLSSLHSASGVGPHSGPGRPLAIRTVGGSYSGPSGRDRRRSSTARQEASLVFSSSATSRPKFLHSASVPAGKLVSLIQQQQQQNAVQLTHGKGKFSSTPEERAALALMALGSM